MSKIQTNFIYNTALTLASYIMGFIVFPYVSRVLGVENVGRIGFVNNVISYFSLFAYFGVRSLAIREIAACGDDREERSNVFSSIVSFLLISTAVVSIVYFAAIITVPRFREDTELLVIGSMTLIFTSFLLEWLYQGLENFRFVTIRSIAIRVIYVICVFIFVKESEDYILYFALTVATVVVNAAINIVYSRNFVNFSFRRANIRKYIKPIFSLGIYNIMVSMYTTFNVIYLGFVCSNTEVGYYSTATKLYTIILGVFSAFTSVMLPRMSSLLSEGKLEEFHSKIRSSFEIVFSMSIPIAVYCVMMAPDIIRIISGIGYEGAITPMRIILCVFVLTSMAQIWVLQVLMPQKKDNVILKSSILGAAIGLIMNFLIVRNMGSTGTAIVLLSSELAGNVYSFVYVIRNKLISFPYKVFTSILIGAIPYVLVAIVVCNFINNPFYRIIIVGLLSAIYFFIFNKILYPKTYVSQYLASITRRRKL